MTVWTDIRLSDKSLFQVTYVFRHMRHSLKYKRTKSNSCQHLFFEPAEGRVLLLAVVHLSFRMAIPVPLFNSGDERILLLLGLYSRGAFGDNLHTASRTFIRAMTHILIRQFTTQMVHRFIHTFCMHKPEKKTFEVP